jgi:hypothetical protein
MSLIISTAKRQLRQQYAAEFTFFQKLVVRFAGGGGRPGGKPG